MQGCSEPQAKRRRQEAEVTYRTRRHVTRALMQDCRELYKSAKARDVSAKTAGLIRDQTVVHVFRVH